MGTYGQKHSEETKRKISEARKKYLNEHPDKIPFKLNHSSKESYPEKYFKTWLKKEKLFEVQELQIDRYNLDFAWPDKKIYLEIDGSQHKLDWMIEHDKIRTEYLNNLGWKCIGRVYWPDYQSLNRKEKHFYLLGIKKAILDSTFIEKFISKKEQKKLIRDTWRAQGKVNSLGRPVGNMLAKNIWEERRDLILNSQVNFKKMGWQEAAQKATGLTRGQIRDTIEHFPEYFKDKVFIRGISISEKIVNKVKYENIIEKRKALILNSKIDFNKAGWLAKLSRLLGISHQNIKKWLIRHMTDFYNNCYHKS